jgi:hypothetical protein
LNRVISPVPFRGTVVSSPPLWSMTRRVVSPSSMVTILPAWEKPTWMRWRATWMPPRLETLPLNGQPWSWEGFWSGEADALERVPLAGRDGAGQGAPQDAVLGDDMHHLTVEADAGPLPRASGGADLDDLAAEGGNSARR